MYAQSVWFVLVAGLVLLPVGPLQGRPPVKAGDPVPGVVVDFIWNSYKGYGHCGCPAVMISNSQGRGIILWSRTADEPVLQLARTIDGLMEQGASGQAYLVLYGSENVPNPPAYKGLIAGKARRAADALFEGAGVPQARYAVFLVEKKQVKAFWAFKPGEMTREKSAAILEEATTFLRPLGPAKKASGERGAAP